MKEDKNCVAPIDEEVVTVEENGRPPMEIIQEGPTQPEERVQFNDDLENAEVEAKEAEAKEEEA